ncbi:MAG TPA: hypothetical protein VGU63_15310 [Candidatus Acidoferrales bacterium]|nr:hypothetical protein [Candidatus Acidoferrales bacterium]
MATELAARNVVLGCGCGKSRKGERPRAEQWSKLENDAESNQPE